MNDDVGANGMTVAARVSTDVATARRLADALAETLETSETAVAVYADGTGEWTVEVHFERPPDQPALRALVDEIAGPLAAGALSFSTIAPKDWVAASLAGLAPVAVGRFVVHGAHDRARVPPHRIGIEIEAALAFGTGHHGTTRGCLLALDQILKRQSKLPGGRRNGLRILDVGTGTGVLAIAAARALRQRVLASDIDARAVGVARANARLNKTGSLIEFVHTAGLASRRLRRGAPYDLVLANILLPALMRMASPMARLLAPGARVVLSGLLTSQANTALAAYRAQRLVLLRRIPLDDWVTLVLAADAPKRHRPGRHRPGR